MSVRQINIMRCALIFTLVLCMVFVSVQGTPLVVAHASEVNFDDTNVLDDLRSSSVNGQPFDLKAYPYNDKGTIQIIAFVEYCYSFKANRSSNYGLYVYVYNPQGLNLNATSKQNKIQMAVAYDGNGNPTRYEKFNLTYCNKAEESAYKNLFYKFKVYDRKLTDGTTFRDRVNSNERRYDISGIELLTYGNPNATEYGVGGTYKFTGYAEGYGPDESAESSLSCAIEDVETLELSVHHTNYRTNMSNLGEGHYNEVNTVYFAVPERIFETYGNLQKIRAEWWEYKTQYAAVTSNQDFYQKLLANVDNYASEADYQMWYGYYQFLQSGSDTLPIVHSTTSYDWAYNIVPYHSESLTGNTVVTVKDSTSIIPYAFYSPSVDLDTVFNFLYTEPVAGDVKGTVVQEWIYNYSNNLGNGYIDCNGRSISKDLFQNSVDVGRTMGYNDKTIDLGDTFDLLSYDSNHSWIEKLFTFGFSWPETDGDYYGVKPIQILEASDLVGTNEQISEALLVNRDDVSELQGFYAEETLKGNKVVLFRFATTDYFSMAVGRTGVAEKNADTYIASQTVFFDFDIIELTFNKDGVYHVIPVVSSPTDIVNGFTAPATEFEWWKILVAVILLVLLIVLLYPILGYIIRFLIWLISLPVKAIEKASKKAKEKKKNKGE